MSKIKWGDFLGGFLTIAIKGTHPEKIINLALSRGIFLWDIKKTSGSMTFRVRSSAYRALDSLANEHSIELDIIDKQGLPFYRQLLKRRSMLIWGALIFIISLYMLSSFVWFLNVSGNLRISEKAILKSAARHGLCEGALKFKFSKTAVEEGILRDLHELAYVEVDIKGVRAHIKVVEKILPGNELTGPCHLVAARDGIIDSLLVLKGQALVREGDTVARGNILVSGIVFPEAGPKGDEEDAGEVQPYTVRAQGQVKARVWYDGYGEWPLIIRKVVLTGKKAERINLKTPWREYCLRKEAGNFPRAQEKTMSYFWNSPWGGIGWETVLSREEKVISMTYSENEALERAQSQALANLKRKMGRGEKVLDTRIEMLSSPTESLIRVKAHAEVLEEIGIPQPINVQGIAN